MHNGKPMTLFELHTMLVVLLLFAAIYPAFTLTRDALRRQSWVPVTSEVYWKGERCEIQSNQNGKLSDWRTRFVVDCSDAEGSMRGNKFVQRNDQFSWRIHKEQYLLVLFESDGAFHGKFLASGASEIKPINVKDRINLLHRKKDFAAVYQAYTAEELSIRRRLLCLILAIIIVNLMLLRREYIRAVAEYELKQQSR